MKGGRIGLASVCLLMAAGTMEHSTSLVVDLLAYVKRTWYTLTRTHQNLAAAAVDPKLKHKPGQPWLVYVARDEDLHGVEVLLRKEMGVDYQKIDVRPLPEDEAHLSEPGLLYLPKPYVVPGGRFNEMYGWDSYFIQIGLLRDGEVELAKDLADNCLYEIRMYGKILNANRTYYLTRSQPPFLTEMLLGVYKRTGDRKWLADAVPAVVEYYRFWTTEPHLTRETGLSRYYDTGDGPAPEVLSSEIDVQGKSEYDLVREYYRTHRVTDYDVSEYYDGRTGELTSIFYKGDRSMRESGFDPSNRFGPFSVDIIHYNPVCLNTLLYLMEMQTAETLEIVGRGQEASPWRERARVRALRINELMWDENAGLYFDYEFVHKHVRHYPFLTAFYPLFAGIASESQAARVVKNLSLFERTGGLQTSTKQTGDQWDAPFGWAPLQWIAIQGLRRYGYNSEADRVSMGFLSLALAGFEQHNTLVEKYDVVHCRTDIAKGLRFGYHSNEAGFGWTNAVFTSLFDELSPEDRANLRGAAAAHRLR